jgi:hypothetical protein
MQVLDNKEGMGVCIFRETEALGAEPRNFNAPKQGSQRFGEGVTGGQKA